MILAGRHSQLLDALMNASGSFLLYLGFVASHLHKVVKEPVGHHKLLVLLVFDLVLERCSCSRLGIVSKACHIVQRRVDRPLLHVCQCCHKGSDKKQEVYQLSVKGGGSIAPAVAVVFSDLRGIPLSSQIDLLRSSNCNISCVLTMQNGNPAS